MNIIISCIACGKKLSGKQTKFCCANCKNKLHQSYFAQKIRGLKRKFELIKLSGGKCSICGYNKNLAALTFHHKDFKDKDFKLDMRSLSNRKESSTLSEFKKCQLLCHNCHAELHNPHLDLALLSL